MEIDTWIAGYKVRSFPWVDQNKIYFNVQYYAPGQSLSRPPVWDRTVYIKNNASGQRVVRKFTDSLVRHIATMPAGHFDIGVGKRLLFDFAG